MLHWEKMRARRCHQEQRNTDYIQWIVSQVLLIHSVRKELIRLTHSTKQIIAHCNLPFSVLYSTIFVVLNKKLIFLLHVILTIIDNRSRKESPAMQTYEMSIETIFHFSTFIFLNFKCF